MRIYIKTAPVEIDDPHWTHAGPTARLKNLTYENDTAKQTHT